jgi:CheY-like chemotaxis protein
MANVLVLDPGDASCHLVRSVLLGQSHGVSLSTDFDEARRKLETGLFDGVFVDLSRQPASGIGFIRWVNSERPDLPVTVLHRAGRAPDADAVKAAGCLERPVRIRALVEVARRMFGDGRAPRPAMDIEVDLAGDEHENVSCRARGLSVGGVLLESAPAQFGPFSAYFERPHESVRGTLVLGAEDRLEFGASVAFAERTHFQRIQRVGLAFAGLAGADRDRIASFLARAR